MDIPDFGKLLKSAQKVKLAGGLVGRLSMVLIVSATSLAAIVVAVREPWIALTAILALCGLVGILGWKMIGFANKNPKAALLEGSEFLLHQQMEYQFKGQEPQIIDPDSLISDPARTLPALLEPPEQPDQPQAGLLEPPDRSPPSEGKGGMDG
jgi:hypothetical protein